MDTFAPDTLQQAIMLIRMDRKEYARDLFLQTVRQDPDCINAWLWLSELAESLEEQTAMLEEALIRIPAGSPKTLQDYQVELHGAIALGPSIASAAAPEASGVPANPPVRPDPVEARADDLQSIRLAMLEARESEARASSHGAASHSAAERRSSGPAPKPAKGFLGFARSFFSR